MVSCNPQRLVPLSCPFHNIGWDNILAFMEEAEERLKVMTPAHVSHSPARVRLFYLPRLPPALSGSRNVDSQDYGMHEDS